MGRRRLSMVLALMRVRGVWMRVWRRMWWLPMVKCVLIVGWMMLGWIMLWGSWIRRMSRVSSVVGTRWLCGSC